MPAPAADRRVSAPACRDQAQQVASVGTSVATLPDRIDIQLPDAIQFGPQIRSAGVIAGGVCKCTERIASGLRRLVLVIR